MIKPITLRNQLNEVDEYYEKRVQTIHKNAWQNLYVNELVANMEHHGFSFGTYATISQTLVTASSSKGCDDVMRFIARLERQGWEFDYDEIKFDGYYAIDFKPCKPVGLDLTISIGISTSPNCRIIEEKTHELTETIKRTVVCS